VRSIDSIAHLLRGRSFAKVLGAYDYDMGLVFVGGQAAAAGAKVVVFSHNTPSFRILCDDWGDEILIHHNHYMTSFLDNVALASMAGALAKAGAADVALPPAELAAGLGRKFLAEQMFEIADSRMARVLFLENLIATDDAFRGLFALRDATPALAASSHLFTAMASDFLLHHELGHVVSGVDAFAPFMAEALAYGEKLPAYRQWLPRHQARFRDEAGADVFALTVVMKVYAELAAEPTLRSYLAFLIGAVVRMEVLYRMAADAHRANVDPAFDPGDVDLDYAMWHARLDVMSSYLDGVAFDAETVTPLAKDAFLPLDGEVLHALTGTEYAAPISPATRQVAEAISLGFEGQPGFGAVIEASRVTRQLDRRGPGTASA